MDLQKNCTLIEAFIADQIVGTRSASAIGPNAPPAASSRRTTSTRSASVRPWDAASSRPRRSGRNAHPVTVISYQLWQERFRGDPAIVGKTQMFNGVPHTIVGVAPEGFYGTFVGYAFQFWVPASMQEAFDHGDYKLEDRGARWIEGFARLKPGVTPRAGAGGDLGRREAPGERVSGDQPRARHQAVPLWQTPFNNARHLLPTLSDRSWRWPSSCC